MKRRRYDPQPRPAAPLSRSVIDGLIVVLLPLGAGTLAAWACRLLGWP
jgi:hypothetical protein